MYDLDPKIKTFLQFFINNLDGSSINVSSANLIQNLRISFLFLQKGRKPCFKASDPLTAQEILKAEFSRPVRSHSVRPLRCKALKSRLAAEHGQPEAVPAQ
ncbi:MAG: hypothetical protein ACLR4D_00885 [Faecalibacterium sp.]